MTPAALRLAYREFACFDRAFDRQIAEYESHNDATVTSASFDLIQLHQLMASGGEDWDLFLCSTDWLPQLIAEGRLRPLDGYLRDDPPEGWPEDWPPSLLQLQRDQAGNVFGIPYHDGPEMLLYRKDLFEDDAESARFQALHGRPLEPPRTWNEFREVASHFSRHGEGLSGCVLAAFPDAHNSVYDFLLQLWSRGGELLEGRRAAFHGDAGRAGLAYLAGLIEDGLTQPDPLDFESVRAGDLYAAGGAAMMWNWSGFSIVAELPDSPIRGRTGLARIPKGDGAGASHVSFSTYWVLTIPSGSRHPDRAWELIRSTASAAMDRVTAVEGGNACRLSTWRDPEIQARFPCYRLMEDVHARARTLPPFAKLPRVLEILNDAIDSVYRHRQPVAAALDAAATAASGVLAEAST